MAMNPPTGAPGLDPQILLALLQNPQLVQQLQSAPAPAQEPPAPADAMQTVIANIVRWGNMDESELSVSVKVDAILKMSQAFYYLAQGVGHISQAQNQVPADAQHALQVAKTQHEMALAEQDQQHRHALELADQAHRHKLAELQAQHQIAKTQHQAALAQDKQEASLALQAQDQAHRQALAERQLELQAQARETGAAGSVATANGNEGSSPSQT